jgi:hypothetical protein
MGHIFHPALPALISHVSVPDTFRRINPHNDLILVSFLSFLVPRTFEFKAGWSSRWLDYNPLSMIALMWEWGRS